MNLILIFLLGIIIGAGVVWMIMKKKNKELEIDLKRMEKEKQEEERVASGLADFNSKMQEIKENNKQKILKQLAERGKIKTNEVADILEVSRATAFRYLEELEKEGKIKQIGTFGKNVKYVLNASNSV